MAPLTGGSFEKGGVAVAVFLLYIFCMTRQDTEAKIQEVVQGVVEKFDPERVILFGSWAWGNPTPDSDVDLFIIKDTTSSTREVAREIDGSISPRPFPLDILVYRPGDVERSIGRGNFFVRNIVTRGKVLYAK